MEQPQQNCPFCQVLLDDKSNQIIKAGENFTAIRKLYSSKNVNFLVISTRHIKNLKPGNNLKTADDNQVITRIVDMNELTDFINELSEGRDWSMKINNGSKSGQEVFHFHAHVFSEEPAKTWKV